jgi:CelD/BcsL family acetyltransferase involved in cellulose biosynthesis
MGEQDLSLWRDLANSATEPNPYLGPDFMLAALKCLDPERQVVAVFAHQGQTPDAPLGAMLALDLLPVRNCCGLGVTKAYASTHSFVGGLLSRPDSLLTVASLFCTVRNSLGFAAISFRDVPLAGPGFKLLVEAIRAAGLKLLIQGTFLRPVIPTAGRGSAELASRGMGKRRLRDYQRKRRKLQELGALTWRVVRPGTAEFPSAIDTFIRLEDQGWKGAAKTSLRSECGGESFFREFLAAKTNPDSCLFTELLLDEKVIASTFNLQERERVFAFKVGWNSDFSDYSPGILNELYFLEQLDVALPGISYVDSGAQEDSFIGRLWPDRAVMSHLVIPLSFRASAFYWLKSLALWALYRIRRSERPALP